MVEGKVENVRLRDPEHVGWKVFSWKGIETLDNIALTAVAAIHFLDAWDIGEVPKLKRECDCELFLPSEPGAED